MLPRRPTTNPLTRLAAPLVLVALALVVLTSCSSTKFTAYQGSEVVLGKGGTVRVVDGIDIWENGEPDRPYRVVGVIDDSRWDGLFTGTRVDSAIAEAARQNGGGGVILTESSRQLRGVDPNSGTASHTRLTKVQVIEYVR